MRGIKQQVIQMIQSLPEEVTVDDIIAELYFKLQVDAGLKELDEGKGIPHEEIEKRMSKWLTPRAFQNIPQATSGSSSHL